MYKAKAIVRHDVVGFDAGALVYYKETESHLAVVGSVEDPTQRAFLHKEYLLPLQDYLKKYRRLKDGFYIISFTQYERDELPHYLSVPRKVSKSYHKPFKFESEGEAIYYARSLGLRLDEVRILQQKQYKI